MHRENLLKVLKWFNEHSNSFDAEAYIIYANSFLGGRSELDRIVDELVEKKYLAPNTKDLTGPELTALGKEVIKNKGFTDEEKQRELKKRITKPRRQMCLKNFFVFMLFVLVVKNGRI